MRQLLNFPDPAAFSKGWQRQENGERVTTMATHGIGNGPFSMHFPHIY